MPGPNPGAAPVNVQANPVVNAPINAQPVNAQPVNAQAANAQQVQHDNKSMAKEITKQSAFAKKFHQEKSNTTGTENIRRHR